VNEAFHAPIHYLSVKGKRHLANIRDPQIPVALAPAVAGIVSLNDFRPVPMNRPRPKYSYTAGGVKYQAVVPADLATIYNLKPLFSAGITGKGRTIAVVEDTDMYNTSDWTTFRSTFGLAGYKSGKLTTVHPGCADPGVNGDDGEASLDVEWASAAAPNAAIELASCPDSNTTFGGLIALQTLISGATTPDIVSISYGECEAYNGAAGNAAYLAAYKQAVAEGISVFVSAGDEDAASCDAGYFTSFQGIAVSGYASTAYNVAVGGTDFGDNYANANAKYWSDKNTSVYGSAKSYVPEIPWNDSCGSTLGAITLTGSAVTYGPSGFCNTARGENFWNVIGGSGGPSGCATGATSEASTAAVSGTCKGYKKPSWQKGALGVPTDGARDIPDVSLFAGDGIWGHYYVFCYSDPYFAGGAPCKGQPVYWSGAGGTSFSSPILAGIQALVDQKKAARQGNPNPVYYALAKTEYGAAGNAGCNSTKGKSAKNSCVFYDVTLGDNDVNCTTGAQLGVAGNGITSNGPVNCDMSGMSMGVLSTSNAKYKPAYKATTGWDFSTGIGTVNAKNLVNAWP
jgi:subtilase family serine protease